MALFPLSSRALTLCILVGAMAFPALDALLPPQLQIIDLLRPVMILSLLGIALNILTGFTGLLNLGIAAFMAIGAYTYAVLSCEIYPFQLGFWWSLIGAMLGSAAAGFLIGLPTLRLRGDYLAIVTLGFGEIVPDVLRNLEVITQGTQGINPLPPPQVFGVVLTPQSSAEWYYLLLGCILLCVSVSSNLERSRIGRNWIAIREDELAARSLGVPVIRAKLLAFSLAAACAGLCGALWASFLGSSGEPGNYDFQLSILALCMVILGGLGSVRGVLLGALIIVGFNSIVLVRISEALARLGIESTASVYLAPNNYKYLLFGLVLIVMMRVRPQGLVPPATHGAIGEARS